MPSSTYKSLTRKKKAAQQFRRGSKTFRHKKNLRQKISAKKLYTKDKKIGKRFTRVARGFVDDLKAAVNYANKLEEIDRENKEKETECPICTFTMTDNEATELKCNHKFHTICLINALRKDNLVCPLCRKPIGGEISRRLLTDSLQDMLIVAKAVLIEAEDAVVVADAIMKTKAQELRDATESMRAAMLTLGKAQSNSKAAAIEAAIEAADLASARTDEAGRAALAAAEEARAAEARAEEASAAVMMAEEAVNVAREEERLAADEEYEEYEEYEEDEEEDEDEDEDDGWNGRKHRDELY